MKCDSLISSHRLARNLSAVFPRVEIAFPEGLFQYFCYAIHREQRRISEMRGGSCYCSSDPIGEARWGEGVFKYNFIFSEDYRKSRFEMPREVCKQDRARVEHASPAGISLFRLASWVFATPGSSVLPPFGNFIFLKSAFTLGIRIGAWE